MKQLNNLDGLSKEHRVGLRNFFVQQAALSSSVSSMLSPLKGLSALGGSSIPAVKLA
jgi:hypothetical protein